MLPRRSDVKHIAHDYKSAGVSDDKVFGLAFRDKRILVTKNVKHFRPLLSDYKVDVIGVTEAVGPEELDKAITARLRKWGKTEMSGRFTAIVRAPRR
jgi:hypothetical protein